MKTGVSPDYWSKAKADEVFTGSETSSSSSYYNFLNDDYIVKTYMQDPSHSSDVCRTVKSSTYCSKASDESVSVNTSHETISVSLGSFSLSKDYYISKATVVSGGYTKNNNYSIKITGVEKAIATATNKSTDTTNLLTSKLSTFYIKVPVSSVTENKTVLLKVSRTGSVECSYDEPKGYISTITDDTVQDIYVYSGVDTTTISTEKSVNDSATASIIPTTTSVRIIKTDEDGKTPISGTKFMIYTDSKASTPMADQVETLSNKDGEILFSKLIYGQTYYIKETLPAIGYKSNDTIYKVVANTTNEIKLPITNNKTYIKISKKDIASKVEVPGAEIVIKDAYGTEVVKYTSSNEESAKYYLPAGEYILTESIAPANYKILASEIKFSISSTGEVNILNDASDYYEVVNGYTITLYDEVINPKTASGIRTILIAIIGLGATSIYIYNTYKIKKQLI